MLKILLRKTISSLMLMTLALFLVSFNFEPNINYRNEILVYNNNLNFNSSTDIVSSVSGLKLEVFGWTQNASLLERGIKGSKIGQTINVEKIDYSSSESSIVGSTNTNFFASFKGYIIPEFDVTWFQIPADDGVRVYLGAGAEKTLVYDDWNYQGMNESLSLINTRIGFNTSSKTPIPFELEFFQGTGPWGLQLKWSGSSSGTFSIVPKEAFAESYPTRQLDFNVDSTITSIVGFIDGDYTKPSNPIKVGFEFTGWSPNLPDKVPYENTTYIAQFSQVSPTQITLIKNNNESNEVVNATFNSSMPDISIPSKTGSTFLGYFDQDNGSGTIYYDSNGASQQTWTLKNPIDLYAHWSVNNYTLSFNTSGGTPSIESITAPYNSSLFSITSPQKNGYTFNGWSPALPTNVPAANTTYTAQWTAVTNTITLINNNGTANTSTAATYDSTLANVSVPLKTGHTFNGYYANEDFTGDQIYNQSGMSTLVWNQTVNINLYAKWTINPYNITINNNLGSSITSVQNYGTKVSTPTTPTAPGLTFLGWFKNNDMTLEYDFDEEISSNLNIVAKWGLLENQEIYFNNEFSLSDATLNFAGGYLILENSNKNAANDIFLKNSNTPFALDHISILVNNVYIGLGDNKKKLIGVIDNVKNGLSGQDLKINLPLPTSEFLNGSFSEPTTFSTITANNNTTSIVGWTLYNKKFDLAGFKTWDFSGHAITLSEVSLTEGVFEIYRELVTPPGSPSSNFMVLNLKSGRVPGTDRYAKNSSAFGPYMISAPFNFNKSDNIQFYWKAIGKVDSYHVLAFLRFKLTENGTTYNVPILNKLPSNLDNSTNQSINVAAQQQVNAIPENINFSAKLTEYINRNDNGLTQPQKDELSAATQFLNAEFIFSGGSYDDNGFTGLGASFYVGNISVQQTFTETSIVDNLVRNLKLDFQDDNPNINTNNNLTLTLVDSSSDDYIFSKNINIVPVNDAPTRSGTLTLNATQNQAISIDFGQYFTDPDSTLTFSASNLPSNLSLSSAGVLTGTLSNSNVGNNLITITASDGVAAPVSAEYTLAVANVNDAPIVNSNVTLPNYEIQVGNNIVNSFTLPSNLFIDIDPNDVLTYSMTGLPSGLTFNASSLTVSGSVASNVSLPIQVTLRATDNGVGNLSVTRTFNISKMVARVNFYDSQDTLLATIAENPGASITLSTTAPNGYVVAGWYTEKTFENIYQTTIMPASVVNLFGQFAPIEYNITYSNLVNGMNNINNPAKFTIESSNISLLNPTRNGYTFGGWYDNNAFTGTSINSISAGSYGNKTIYAKWTANSYTITLDLVGGSGTRSIVGLTDSVVSQPANPNRVGHVFVNWSQSIPQVMPPNNLLITANWRPKVFNFSFDLNHQSNDSLYPITLTFGTPLAGIETSLTRGGYEFGGWFRDRQLAQGFEITPLTPDLGADNSTIELFAKWVPLEFNINYVDMIVENNPNPKTYNAETSTIRLITNFNEPGLIFKGFFDNPNFEGDPITSIPSGSFGEINLYANFEKEKFDLTIVDNGEELFNEKIEVGKELGSLTKGLEKEGYEFIGFSNSEVSKMPASNLELVAQFKPKQYKLTIDTSNGAVILNQVFDFGEDLAGIKLEPKEIDGFVFVDWSQELPDKMPASDLTITANYRGFKQFKLTILGTKDQVLIEAEFFEKQPITGITLPNLTGASDFNFEGWDNPIPEVMPSGDFIIKPLGSKRLNSISLFSQDLTFIGSVEAQIGTSVSIPRPTRLGYNFSGWTDQTGNSQIISIMPETEESLFASWQPKIYTILVTVGSNDFSINITFGDPVGNIVTPSLFGYRFEGWKNNLTGDFINSNTIFNTPEQINLVPVFTRLNAAETLVAATRLISDFILRLFR
jgi:uncharacterized repeat protein (TIGR02543 family)